MRRFRFRFEAVLKQRAALLDAARGELAEIMGRHTLSERLLGERRAQLDAMLTREETGVIDAGHEMLRQRHIYTVREEVRRREYQLGQLEEHLEAARQAVTEAHRELRAIEILEERDRETWVEEVKREEQKSNDDLNSARSGRS